MRTTLILWGIGLLSDEASPLRSERSFRSVSGAFWYACQLITRMLIRPGAYNAGCQCIQRSKRRP